MFIERFVEKILIAVDKKFKTNYRQKALKVLLAWYGIGFMNSLRRLLCPRITYLKYLIGLTPKPLILHLGCGDKHFPGYINVDWRKTTGTDLVCDIRKLPFPANSAQRIETYHVIEHLPRHDLPKVLKHWYQIMAPGGQLIIECPDFDKAARDYLNGNEERLNNIFGHQRYPGDAHLYGYNFKRLKQLLESCGFTDVREMEPVDSHAREEPSLRVECIKGNT